MVGTSETDAASAARAAIASALHWRGGLCVLTGAGMSAESGIATFRDALTGHWARFNPAEMASEDGFRAHPQRVWDWYDERRAGVRAARPNAGHMAIAACARRHPGALVLVTQNVDDLHQRAGNTDALQLHGDILEQRWLDACPRQAERGFSCSAESARPGRPPRCAECGNRLRPGVVWFGEELPRATLAQAELAAEGCAVMLVVGTSGAVWPAAGLAARARDAGAHVVIVNPIESAIDDVACTLLRGTAAGLLPGLLAPVPGATKDASLA